MLPRRDSKPLDIPALLPMFGGMEKKPRFLDREVITMGRARGSDFCLDGNEVSALHCIIFRAADGFRVRDCGSRTGTRVNGQSIKNALLGNGDVLQIGPFSFEVRLPKGLESAVTVDPGKVDRLKRSRSHLVHLALRLRKKLITNKGANGRSGVHSGVHGGVGPAPTPIVGANLSDSGHDDKRAAELKAKIKQYDNKVNQLEESEKELFEEQEALRKEKREWDARVKAQEAEFAARKKELDDEFQARWESLQGELQNLKSIAPAAAAVATGPSPEQLQELENIEAKKKELDALSQKLKARDKELNDDYKEILKERDQLEKLRQQWEQEQIDARKQLDQHRETISSAEFTLNDQKSQIGVMIEQLRKMQEDLRATAQGDTAVYQEQIALLKKELAEARAANPQGSGSNTAELEAELESARSELAVLKESFAQASGLSNEVQAIQKEMAIAEAQLQEQVRTLLAENEAYRQQLTEPNTDPRISELDRENRNLKALADELTAKVAAASTPNDELVALRSENESLKTLVGRLEEVNLADAAARPADDEVRQENQVLRRLLEEAEVDLQRLKEGAAIGGDAKKVEQLENENEILHKLLQEKDKMMQELHSAANEVAGEPSVDAGKLQAEVDLLKNLLRNKDDLIEELKAEAEKAPGNDPDAYEADLNRFRKELEADRARLNREIESLRQRNVELDEATREMEMELSRERAEMARERIRLDRMREEVKADMERLQREMEVRGTLAPVQKLREELLQKNPPGGPPKNAADRLKTMSRLQ